MESTSSLCSSSSLLPSSSIFENNSKPQIKIIINQVMMMTNNNKRVSLLLSNKVYASAAGSGRDHHRLVDENMIVLRKRIHEMKMVERNYEPPENWMDWEKKCYTSYDSFICDAMGVVQGKLMNARPSLALGIMALIALSVPTSTALVCFRFMEIANEFLAAAGIQHVS